MHHDGIGYVFPDKAHVVLSAEKQEGDWHDIVMASRNQPAAENVFSLWIDHGKPVSAGTYCYRVLPGVEPEAMEARAKSPAVRVLNNTPALQAVWDAEQKMALAAFYERGRVANDDLNLSVDRPCLLLAKKGPAALQLAVSNPAARPLEVSVEVNQHLEGDGCQWLGDRQVSRVKFELPVGENAGKSVTRRLTVRYKGVL